MKKTVLVLPATLALAFAALPLHAAPAVVSQVGSETVTDGDLRFILSQHANGNEAMAMIMMAQMSEEEKLDFVTQITDALLLAQAAQRKGYQLDEGVARRLRWDAIQTLSQAYMAQVAAGWDLSEKAMEAYYAAHEADFVQNEAVHVRHILVDSEEKARSVLLKAMSGENFAEVAARESLDQGSARKGGDLGWVERGQTVPSFEETAFSLKAGRLGGPVKSDFGWHVMEVLERRDGRTLSYAEARPLVAQALQQHYMKSEIERLRASGEYVVNEAAAKGLGRITQ